MRHRRGRAWRLWAVGLAAALAGTGSAFADAPTKNAEKPAKPAAQAKIPAGVKRLADLEYSAPATGPLALDLFLPEADAGRPLPMVVWIHGGGWANGSKQNCPLAYLAARGYAVASVDYRLTAVAQWPAQIDDCRAAVRWLRLHASAHGLDPDRVGVAGGSAGGHLAALLGTLDPPADETVSSRVRAVCDLYGPSDLLTMPPNVPGPGKTDADLANSNGAKLLGGTVKDRPELARQASALFQASAGDAPFLILHGDQDQRVPLDQSQRLHERLQEVGVPSELVVLPAAGHGGPAFQTPEIQARVKQFFDAHLQPRKDAGQP